MSNAYIYEFFGNGFSGRIKIGQLITKEMLMDKDGVLEIENFILKKSITPVEKPKKGESAFKEEKDEKWMPGFLRISEINFIYAIEV